jgi:hypothetical protein
MLGNMLGLTGPGDVDGPTERVSKIIETLWRANKTKINWQFLSGNPNPEAIELLKENQKKIDWSYLSGNPAIFDEILE